MIWLAFLLATLAEPGGSALRADDDRVARIGYKLASAGASHCPDPYPLTGLLLHHLAEYGPGDQQSALEHYRLDRGPGVLAVQSGSPAALAGIKAGDLLLAVNDKPPAVPPRGEEKVSRLAVEAVQSKLEEQLRAGAVRLRLLRGNRSIETRLEPVSGCLGRVRLARSSQFNAFANRGYAIVTTEMLNFAKSDDELAVILAHEMAHVILKHPEQLDAEGVPTGLLRGFGRNAARVYETEEEADRLGLKLVAAAGYDVNAALPFWRRFYARKGDFPQIFRTHPSFAARKRIIEDELAKLGASNPGSKRP